MLMLTELHEIMHEENAETGEKKCKLWVHTNSGDLIVILESIEWEL